MIVKCSKCGREYELDPGDNPENFQCECGGKLTKKRLVNSNHSNALNRLPLSSKRLILIGVALLGIIVVVFVLIGSGTGKLIGEYDFTTASHTDLVVHVPEGTQNLRIEYSNVMKETTTGSQNSFKGNIYFQTFNIDIPEGQDPSDFRKNRVEIRDLWLTDNVLNGNLTINSNGAKVLVIRGLEAKGHLKVYTA